MLDSRGCLRRAEIISRGSLTGAPVHPRDVFRLAAAYQAVSLILFHNHPFGGSGTLGGGPATHPGASRMRERSWGSRCSITS